MSRIAGIDPKTAAPDLREVFDRQAGAWGNPLGPYLVYARRPPVFHAVLGMWAGLKASGLLDAAFKSLLCRRVASLNGCVF